MIYKEEIEYLALKLRAFRNTFIFGQAGCGKTYIIDEYLKGLNLENNKVFQLTTLDYWNCLTGGIDEFLEKSLNEMETFYKENENLYKEFIFDDFRYIQIGQPESIYNEFLEFISSILDDNKTRCIFISQRINFNWMFIINKCSDLFLGKTPTQADLNKYRNFTRNLDFTNKNFEIIEK